MLDLNDVFTTFPVLETERYILRAVTEEDAADIFHIMSDPLVTRYLGRYPMTMVDEAVQRVYTYQTTFQQQSGIAWAVTRRGYQQVIGTCVFWNLIPEHFRAETGYVLGTEWWGQGVMTEAMSAVLTFGFATMSLHSVEARTDPSNTGSKRLLEKLGFVQEGYFREDFYHPVEQRFTDTSVFSLLKSTWMKRIDS